MSDQLTGDPLDDRQRNPLVILATAEGLAVFAEDPSELEVYVVDTRPEGGSIANGGRPYTPAELGALLAHFGTLPVVRRLWYRLVEGYGRELG